jgi:hypothetical protein
MSTLLCRRLGRDLNPRVGLRHGCLTGSCLNHLGYPVVHGRRRRWRDGAVLRMLGCHRPSTVVAEHFVVLLRSVGRLGIEPRTPRLRVESCYLVELATHTP